MTNVGALAPVLVAPGHDVRLLCGRLRSSGARPGCLRLVDDERMQAPTRQGWAVYCSEVGPHAQIELTVSVVIPAMNEARNLPSVLLQIPEEDTEVVVVDGRSSDGTVEVVRELRPEAVVVVESARGKGNALRAGFEAASGDIIVMMDADGSMSPREIPLLVGALVRGADVAKGSRSLGGSEDLTTIRRLGNRGLCTAFNLIHGTRHTDLAYGYLAFWRHHLDALMPDCSGFEVETILNVRAAQAGLRTVEVASYEGRRGYGSSNLHAFRDGIRCAWAMVGEGWRSLLLRRSRAERRCPGMGTTPYGVQGPAPSPTARPPGSTASDPAAKPPPPGPRPTLPIRKMLLGRVGSRRGSR